MKYNFDLLTENPQLLSAHRVPFSECPAGQFVYDGVCFNCEDDEWSEAGAEMCTACPQGTIIENPPGTSASDCEIGEWK